MNIIILLLINSILNTISLLADTSIVFRVINLGISLITLILVYKKYKED